MEGPSPGLVRTRANFTAPSAKHTQNWPPAPEASTVWGQGLTPLFPSPSSARRPKVPRHPTSRTEPASFTPACPAAQRTPHLSHRQEHSTPAFPTASSRQMPPDQLAQPAVETPQHLPPPSTTLEISAVFQRSVRLECISESLFSLIGTPNCFWWTDGGEETPTEPGPGCGVDSTGSPWGTLFFPPPALGLFLGSPSISASRQNRLEEQPKEEAPGLFLLESFFPSPEQGQLPCFPPA